MKHTRWLNWVIAGVLLTLAVVTIRQLAAASQVVSANASQAAISQPEKVQNPFECPFTPEQIRTIHPEYIKEIGSSIPFTDGYPTGVEGGMNMLRFCKTP